MMYEYSSGHLLNRYLDEGVEHVKIELVPNVFHAFLAPKKQFDTGRALTERFRASAKQWKRWCSLLFSKQGII